MVPSNTSMIMKMVVAHAIELLDDIVASMFGKQCFTWETDPDRPMIMNKLTKVVSYFTITGLFRSYVELEPIKYLLSEKDENYVFDYLTKLLPDNIVFLKSLP